MAAVHELPLLLDDAMQVEGALNAMNGTMALDAVDLFGDPVAALDLPPRPAVSNALLQRLDELRCRGCCQ
jgi:hypothetical protein